MIQSAFAAFSTVPVELGDGRRPAETPLDDVPVDDLQPGVDVGHCAHYDAHLTGQPPTRARQVLVTAIV